MGADKCQAVVDHYASIAKKKRDELECSITESVSVEGIGSNTRNTVTAKHNAT